MQFLSMFSPENAKETILAVIGGLAIFLFGMNLMGDSLKSLAGNKLKVLIEKATSTPLKGIITGALVTVLLQSSSATTVIVIGLISAGLMSLPQSIGVMMGANIGTTVTAFLIGLKVSDYSFLIIGAGAVFALFFAKRKINLTGSAILGFGLLFLGLEIMGSGLKDLSKAQWFKDTITSFSAYPVLGVLAGTGLTFITQSSSASIGVLQTLFYNQSIELSQALTVLLGCNIGTTITALLASLGGNTESKQSAVFNLLFNTFGTIVFMIFLAPYTQLSLYYETFLGPYNRLTIAFAHITFNVISTLIVFFLIRYFILFIKKIIPARKDRYVTLVDKLNLELLETSPVLALANVKYCLHEMGEKSYQMIKLAKNYSNENNNSFYEACLKIENDVDYYDHKIHEYLMKMQTLNLSEDSATAQVVYLDTIRDFERIADHSVNLVEFFYNRYELNVTKDNEMMEDLNYFFDKIDIQVSNTLECFKTSNKKLAHSVLKLEEEIDTLEKKYRRAQLNRISNQSTMLFEDLHLVDILSNLERISDHCSNIAENVIDPHHYK